jgi:eukaryotic-like serine/threonine-protein kinase
LSPGLFSATKAARGEDVSRFGLSLGKDSGTVLETSVTPNAPSNELVRQLTELRLCRTADFRRARSRVRRLARDLPAFDSVWIDALVQIRRLTPYQARLLETESASQLRIGSYVMVDRLGSGPHATTLLARSLDQNELCALKRLRLNPVRMPECRERLLKLLEQTAGWSHPNLVVPHALPVCADEELVAISRWVPGVPLSELLVRRGRFPSAVVVEVVRQLAGGLAALHQRGVVHGDIRLGNVRLSARGAVVLVDAGVRPAVCPEVTIHETLALEAYDGIAPELIGTGLAPNAVSEIYALGCLLWQLLAGRPPHPVADPLMKLAAHQTQRISDVRAWAPDTPPGLAETLFAMTSPQPNERPQSFAELLQRIGRSGMTSRSRLKRYRRSFDRAVPHFTQPTPGLADNRWPWIAASLFVIAGAAVTLADKGLRNELVAITQRAVAAVRATGSATATSPESPPDETGATVTARRLANGLLELPQPSADGEIVLAEAGPFDVTNIAVPGGLTIRGANGVHPVIQIGREPLRLAAESVTLANVVVRFDDRASRVPPAAMILVRSQQLTIRDCEFVSPARSDETRSTGDQTTSAVAWQPSSGATPETTQYEIENTIFRGTGTACWFAESPRRVTVSNCLKLSDGACFAIARKASARPIAFEVNRLTLRDSGPLLRFGGAYAEEPDAAKIEFLANDCVWSPKAEATGLIEIQSPQPRPDVKLSLTTTGQGSVIRPGINLMTVVDSQRGVESPVPDADEQFQGLVVSDLEFAGQAGGAASQSQLVRLSAPRSSTDASVPGIDPALLPSNSEKSRSASPTP